MKLLASIFFVVLFAVNASAQTDKDRAKWAADLVDGSKVSSGAERDRILKRNFGPMWIQQEDSALGYIGNDYQRLRIIILSATKHPSQPDTYNVAGKTMVKNVVRAFSGTITITKVGSTPHSKLDEEYKNEQLKEAGFVVGEYHFAEDAKETNTGKFDGFFKTDWIVDKEGRLQYDEVMGGADGYYNNQFAGKWTSFRTKASKPASWGDSRIPISSGFDVGDGEFSPNQKFVRNGWQGYKDAYGPKQDKQALAEEDRKWWQ